MKMTTVLPSSPNTGATLPCKKSKS